MYNHLYVYKDDQARYFDAMDYDAGATDIHMRLLLRLEHCIIDERNRDSRADGKEVESLSYPSSSMGQRFPLIHAWLVFLVNSAPLTSILDNMPTMQQKLKNIVRKSRITNM